MWLLIHSIASGVLRVISGRVSLRNQTSLKSLHHVSGEFGPLIYKFLLHRRVVIRFVIPCDAIFLSNWKVAVGSILVTAVVKIVTKIQIGRASCRERVSKSRDSVRVEGV